MNMIDAGNVSSIAMLGYLVSACAVYRLECRLNNLKKTQAQLKELKSSNEIRFKHNDLDQILGTSFQEELQRRLNYSWFRILCPVVNTFILVLASVTISFGWCFFKLLDAQKWIENKFFGFKGK